MKPAEVMSRVLHRKLDLLLNAAHEGQPLTHEEAERQAVRELKAEQRKNKPSTPKRTRSSGKSEAHIALMVRIDALLVEERLADDTPKPHSTSLPRYRMKSLASENPEPRQADNIIPFAGPRSGPRMKVVREQDVEGEGIRIWPDGRR